MDKFPKTTTTFDIYLWFQFYNITISPNLLKLSIACLQEKLKITNNRQFVFLTTEQYASELEKFVNKYPIYNSECLSHFSFPMLRRICLQKCRRSIKSNKDAIELLSNTSLTFDDLINIFYEN